MADYGSFEDQAAQARSRQRTERLRKRWKAKVYDAHQKLFFEDDGITLKPAAKICLEDWASASKSGKALLLQNNEVMRGFVGMQTLFQHILARFGKTPDEYRAIGSQMKDVKDE